MPISVKKSAKMIGSMIVIIPGNATTNAVNDKQMGTNAPSINITIVLGLPSIAISVSIGINIGEAKLVKMKTARKLFLAVSSAHSKSL